MEDYLFISGINTEKNHGRNPKLEACLLSLLAQKIFPKIVIFLGDIIDPLDQLQKLFYDVLNPVKKLLKENPYATDIEILEYPINDTKIIADGSQELRNFLHEEFNSSAQENIRYIRELVSYLDFDHFCSNLPQIIKQSLLIEIEKKANFWRNIMIKFINHGSHVVVVAGKYDDCNLFCFKSFLEKRNQKILYCNKIVIKETNKEIFVFLPFDSAINAPEIPKFNNFKKKKIILVSNVPINLTRIQKKVFMTEEKQKIQDNMNFFVKKLLPDYVVHGNLSESSSKFFIENITVEFLTKGSCRFIDFS